MLGNIQNTKKIKRVTTSRHGQSTAWTNCSGNCPLFPLRCMRSYSIVALTLASSEFCFIRIAWLALADKKRTNWVHFTTTITIRVGSSRMIWWLRAWSHQMSSKIVERVGRLFSCMEIILVHLFFMFPTCWITAIVRDNYLSTRTLFWMHLVALMNTLASSGQSIAHPLKKDFEHCIT